MHEFLDAPYVVLLAGIDPVSILINVATALISSFVIGLLTPKQNIKGPRIEDLKVQVSTYGQPIPLLYGRRMRIAGNVIDSTDLIEAKKKQGGKGGPTVTTYSYTASFVVALAEGPVPSGSTITRLWANGKVIFDAAASGATAPTAMGSYGLQWTRSNKTHQVFASLRFYRGTSDQPADALSQAIHGVADTPAYRHTCYLVLEDMALADFGNAIPNLEVELEQPEISVGEVVEDICSRAGVPLNGPRMATLLEGYAIAQDGPAWAALEPLGVAYAFDVVADRGGVRMAPRGGAIVYDIPAEDFAARDASDPPGDRYQISREDSTALPKEVSVSYIDRDLDYQVSSQRAFRDAGNAAANIDVDLPLVLSASSARRAADRILWEIWAGTRKLSGTLSDRWRFLRASQVVTLTVGGVKYPFRLDRVAYGANHVLEVEFTFEDPEVYLSGAVGAPAFLPSNELSLPGTTIWQPVDGPLVLDSEDSTGFYWFATGASSGWRGAEIQRSVDGGVSYTTLSPVAVNAVIGVVSGTVPNGPTDVWDEATTITVTLYRASDELESVTDLDVYNGANRAWIGPSNGDAGHGEYLQFRTATLVGASPGAATYVLSGLLRGRKGTEHAVGRHTAGERFVLIEGDSRGRSDPLGAADWNIERDYRAVSTLTDVSAGTLVEFTNTGEGKRPLSVVHVRGHRDQVSLGSPATPLSDIRITWVRRTRYAVPGLGLGPVPLGEDTEVYEIDVLAGSPEAVVRTVSTSTPTWTYTEAMQSVDGHTLGAPVTLQIYQMSATAGRGRVKRATV